MNSDPLARILVADDEPLYLETTGELLRKAGYECVCVPDAPGALEALAQQRFDLVLSDLNMPGNLKLELLREGRASWPEIPLIVVTGVPSLPSAVESIRLGIADYLLKPVRFDDLLASIRRVLSQRRSRPKPPAQPEGHAPGPTPEILGRSPNMRDLFELIERVAPAEVNVLLTGESGTGKEVVAQAIHRRSRRANHKLQVIDCTAIPESLFESALFGHVKGSFTGAHSDQPGLLKQSHGGTAFFDEIGELPLPLQAKLLRVLQEQTFTPVGSHAPVQIDTRFICATNRDLELEVHAGRFRRDLYYRLAVVQIPLPPLRERGDDVLLLADHFLHELQPEQNRVTGFSPEAIACLRQHSWPGNVRELRNVVERALALTNDNLIGPRDLPESVVTASGPLPACAGEPPANPVTRDEVIDQTEFDYLTSLLISRGGNVSQAAQQAGMSRQGFHKLLKKHGITPADYRDQPG